MRLSKTETSSQMLVAGSQGFSLGESPHQDFVTLCLVLVPAFQEFTDHVPFTIVRGVLDELLEDLEVLIRVELETAGLNFRHLARADAARHEDPVDRSVDNCCRSQPENF